MKPRSLTMLAFGVWAWMGLLQPLAADVIYCGIGNDEFATDVDRAKAAIDPCLNRPGDRSSVMKQADRMQILDKLTAAQMACKPGDIIIIHYAGHGGQAADAAPVDENNGGNNGFEGVIGTSPDSGVTFPDPARDDEIAAILDLFAESCAIISIFDSCFAGEMIDGTADITRGIVIGTSDANNCSPGVSEFLPLWINAFMDNGMGSIKGDINNDRCLTVGELFEQFTAIPDPTGAHPFAVNFDNNPAHLDYVVWKALPEPTSIILVTLGAFTILTGRLRKRQRFVAG